MDLSHSRAAFHGSTVEIVFKPFTENVAGSSGLIAPAKSPIARFVNLFKLLLELILSAAGVTLRSYAAIAITLE